MATGISWPPIGGSAYSIPGAGEVGWPALSNFLIALQNAQGTEAQKIGTRTATSTPVTVVNTDCVVRVQLAAPGAVAVTLPTGVSGQYFVIVDGTGDAATNNITITPTGGQTINGGANYSLNQDNGAVVFCFTGSGNWTIIGSFAASAGGGTIARNAIAAATADYVLINDATGLVSEEQYLSQSRGGFGENVSTFTGVVKAASGNFDAALLVNADVHANAAIDASKIHDGSVSNTEFGYINGVTGPIQTAIDAKLPLAGGTLSGNLSMGVGTTVTLAADPAANLQAATKQYVDNIAAGLKVKDSVTCATTANITLSGAQTIDGVSVGVTTPATRVLVKNQTASQDNGIYTVAAGAWARATDANTYANLRSAFCFVEEGTVNADTGWVCTINAGGTLGVTPITWSQFSEAGNYTISDGLLLTGSVVTVKQDGTDTLTIGPSGVKVKDAAILQTPKIAQYQDLEAQTDKTAPSTGVRIWGTADGRVRKIGAGESSASYLGGGLVTDVKATSFTAVNGFHYLCNTTAGAFTATLPAGATGTVIRFSDDTRTWATYNLTLTPASGQIIGNLLANESLVCDLAGAFVQLMWDGSRWVVDTNGFAASITSGSLSAAQGMGAKNYISNPNNATNWTSTNSTNVAVSTEATASNLPDGYTQTGAIKILRAGGTTDYIYIRFTLDKADYGKKFQLSFDQAYAGSSGDYTLAVYSNTASNYGGTSTSLPLQTSSISGLTGSFITTFDAPNATAPYIEVRVIAAAGTTALYLNNFYVGPGVTVQGAAISNWQSITFATPTNLGTGSATNTAYFYRAGETMILKLRCLKDGSGGSGAGIVTWTMPSGYTINTAVMPNGLLGNAGFTGTNFGPRTEAQALTSTTFVLGDSGTNARFTGIDFTANGEVNMELTIPIAEWSGSGTVNLGAGAQVEYVYNGSTSTTTSDSSSFGYGPQGAQIQNITTALLRRVRFQYPIQDGDDITVEISTNRTEWFPVNGLVGNSSALTQDYEYQNSVSYGLGGVQRVSNTDIDILFGQYQNSFGAATVGAAGQAWSVGAGSFYWRVRKAKASSPVGFGLAGSDGSAGLIPGYATGTWSPAESSKTNLTGTGTYGTATYTRIGNMVFARLETITGYSISTDLNATKIVITTTGLPGITNSTPFYGTALTSRSGAIVTASVSDNSGGSTAFQIDWVANGTGAVSIVSLSFTYTV